MYPDYNNPNGQQNFGYQNSTNQPYGYGFVPYIDPIKLEKRKIRSAGNRIGGAMLISLFGVNIIGTFFVLIASFIGGYGIVDDPMFNIIFQIIFSVLMFVPPFFIVAKLSRFRISDLFVRKKIPAADMFWFVCVGLLVSMGANIIVNYWYVLLENLGCNLDYGSLDMPSSIGGIVLWVVTISVLPAFVEEFAMRVVTLGMLRRFGDIFAILASGLIFGLIHGNMVQIPFAFILGVAFAYITVVTGSVVPAIIIHFINNFYSCVASIADTYCTASGKLIVNYGISTLFVVMGIIGCAMLSRKSYFRKRLYKPKTNISQGSAFVIFFFTSPCMIIASAIYLIEAILLLLPQAANLL